MLPRPDTCASRFARTALLWLALVMAMAQLVAVRHAYSHVPGEAGTQSGGKKHPGGLAHCDACIAVVALGAGAPPPAPLFLAPLDRRLPPAVEPACHRVAPQPRPYAIRAPPAVA